MCGISGFIGESKNLKISHRLITALFRECEIRGDDAAGFWGSEVGSGDIVYHKEPVKSSEFVQKRIWKDLSNLNLNMLLVHARGASVGVGTPSDNKNNHPFVNTSKSIGLVHNGRIPDVEYDVLVKKYEVNSKCDSEILLRIFEAGETYPEIEKTHIGPGEVDEQIANRLLGLRDIWSYIDKGHMAVAIGERANEHDRNLFLFRNKWRSLWIIDCRKDLGQVFFCSTPEIWNAAFRSAHVGKFLKNKIKMIELPTEELWVFQTNATTPVVQKVKKYDICSAGRALWKHEGEIVPIIKNSPTVNVITRLNEKEEVNLGDLIKDATESVRFIPNVVDQTRTVIASPLPENWLYEQNAPFSGSQYEDCDVNFAGHDDPNDSFSVPILDKDFNDVLSRVQINREEENISGIPDNASPAEIRRYWEKKWGVQAEPQTEPKKLTFGRTDCDDDCGYDEYDTVLDESTFAMPVGLKAFSDVCKSIRLHLNNLEAAIENQMLEGITHPEDISELMTEMEQIELDLDGTCRMWISNLGKANDYDKDEPDYYNVS